jgi:tripartite-type tricarboxylate transporter receptor subunit TctC
MPSHPGRLCTLFASLVAVACGAAAQPADGIERPIVIYVAGTAGGGIDLHARLLARHLGRHIAGHPAVSVQVMPGAGGVRAADYLAKVAARDGTALATFSGGPVLEPLIGARNPGYDMSQFTWIGAMSRDTGVCLSWGASRFRTIDDARAHTMVLAGTGAGSETNTVPPVLNHLMGTRFKLVSGYLGTQETFLAIERGEADGRYVSLSAVKTAKPEWLRERKITFLFQSGLERSRELAGVPWLFDLLPDEESRQMITLLVGPAAMARPFAAPPGMAPERASLLRNAFAATMRDPEFLADAARMQAEIAPTRGEEVQAIVARIYATPRPLVEQVKKLSAP